MFFDNKKEYNFSQQLNLHQIYYACNCLGQLKHADLEKEVKNRKAQELKVQIWLIRHKMWNVLKIF